MALDLPAIDARGRWPLGRQNIIPRGGLILGTHYATFMNNTESGSGHRARVQLLTSMLWRSSTPDRHHPPGFIEPALPTLGHALPAGPQWVHEIKHDGYRFICRVEGNRIRVFSRRGTDYTDRVPRIVDTLLRLPASSVTLDGEGVACGPDGVTDFDLLRAALGRPAKREVFLYAFDLLELDGRDMRREPWSARRWKLARLLRGAGHGVQLSDHMESH
jgi:ATP-dependent DNA ligase